MTSGINHAASQSTTRSNDICWGLGETGKGCPRGLTCWQGRKWFYVDGNFVGEAL